MTRPHRSIVRAAVLSLGAALALATPAAAQRAGDGFLFGAPTGSLTLRGGLGQASAGSDIFSFSREQFTLGEGDFAGVSIGGDLAFHLRPRLQLVLGVEYAGSSADSEYRDWVDNEDRPIEQETTFQRVPVTVGLKAYLAGPGRSVGRFAWVPSRLAPYVGAGAGGMWYRFRQAGDFINQETLVVSTDVLESKGGAPTAYANAGLEVSLTPRLALTGEGRYQWGRTGLDENVYQDFEPIDLSGLSATIGLQLRF